jgi:hypothetical protein
VKGKTVGVEIYELLALATPQTASDTRPAVSA